MAIAVWAPVAVSPNVPPGLVGGPSGVPVSENSPAAAWASMSKLRYSAYGPDRP